MRKSRFTEAQIIGMIKEQEAGMPTAEVCRRHGLSTATFYKLKAKYGGMEVSEAARLKALEDENAKLKRLLAAPDPSRALLWMRQSGVLTEILPESEKWGIDAIFGLVETGAALKWPSDPLLRLMAIVPRDAERLDAMASRLRMSNSERKRLVGWARQSAVQEDLADTALRRLLYRGDPQAVTDTIRLQFCARRKAAEQDDEALKDAAALSRLLKVAADWAPPDFPVSGADLLKAGLSSGPDVGAAMNVLEEAWIDSDFTLTRKQLLEKVAP